MIADRPESPVIALLARPGTHILIVAAFLMARLAYLFTAPDEIRLGYIPDDAYYYLVLARNHAQTGIWTFDGESLTSGFHLLWAYLLSGLYRIIPHASFQTVYLITSLAGILAVASAAGLLVRPLTSRLGGLSTLAIPMVLLGGSLSIAPFMGVESALVILLAACVAHLALTDGQKHRLGVPLAIGAGFLGMMARSDFGLLPAAILAGLLIEYLAGSRKADMRPAVAAFAGAVLGLAATLAHNFLTTGAVLQSSAEMKAHWSQLQGHSVSPVLLVLDQITAGWLLPGVLVLAVGAAAAPFALAGRRWLPPLIGGLAAVFGYVIVYRFNSAAIQPWYAASFAIPLALALAVVMATATRLRLPLAVVAFSAAYVLWGFLAWSGPIWGAKAMLRSLGEHIAERPEITRAGMWNSGVVGFYASGKLVNLDGLVNSDVVEFARHGNLADYILARDLEWIADYQEMFSPRMAERGGYGDGRLATCLTPVRNFSQGDPALQWRGTDMTLFRVDLDCLRGSGR